MTPFVYPKAKHRRTETPGALGAYQRYKRTLQKEFSRKCVYCRMPDSIKGYESFHVEHYRPKSKFPELERVYANLFYSCANCNRRKGNWWPSPDEEHEAFIPNPCDHVMFDHMRFEGDQVAARTKPGSFAVHTLDLNDEDSVQYRRVIRTAIEQQLQRKAGIQRRITAIELRLRGGEGDRQALIEARESLDAMQRECHEQLEWYCGTGRVDV